MSLVSGTIGAIMGANAQKDANAKNLAATQQTNWNNMLRDSLSRGAAVYGKNVPKSMRGIASAVLPYYMGGAEAALGRGAADLAMALSKASMSPADRQALIDRFAGTNEMGDELARQMVDGTISRQMQSEMEPVYQARMDTALGKRNAGNDAIADMIAEIDAIQARKGFSGDDYGTRLLKFNARRNIMQQAAADIGSANLENAIQRAATQDSARKLQLNSINLGDARARSALERADLATGSAARSFTTNMGPLSTFNLGPHSMNGAVSPAPVAPVMSPLGNVANSTAAVGNAALDYAMKRDLAARTRSQSVGGGAGALAGSAGLWEGDGTTLVYDFKGPETEMW